QISRLNSLAEVGYYILELRDLKPWICDCKYVVDFEMALILTATLRIPRDVAFSGLT
ncbi:hypothetical protein Bpfe_030705, partial [Biomphalaria pfeifferi]